MTLGWAARELHERTKPDALPFPKEVLDQLRPGLTTEEVRRLLGDPSNGDDPTRKTYSRWPPTNWVEIRFDAQGRLEHWCLGD